MTNNHAPDRICRSLLFHLLSHGSLIWQISFWDALILASARKAHCAVLYSEDLSDGQIYDTVRVINPFH